MRKSIATDPAYKPSSSQTTSSSPVVEEVVASDAESETPVVPSVPALSAEAQKAIDDATAEIKQLEDIIKQLPASFTQDRLKYVARIDALKRSITEAKPLPHQLSCCSAALSRARVRAARAQEAIDKGKSELEAANAAISTLESREAELHAALNLKQEATAPVERFAQHLRDALAAVSAEANLPPRVLGACKSTLENFYAAVQVEAAQAQALSLQAAPPIQQPLVPCTPARGLTRTLSDSALVSPNGFGAEASAPIEVPKRLCRKTTLEEVRQQSASAAPAVEASGA